MWRMTDETVFRGLVCKATYTASIGVATMTAAVPAQAAAKQFTTGLRCCSGRLSKSPRKEKVGKPIPQGGAGVGMAAMDRRILAQLCHAGNTLSPKFIGILLQCASTPSKNPRRERVGKSPPQGGTGVGMAAIARIHVQLFCAGKALPSGTS